jgi:hypothetical protein
MSLPTRVLDVGTLNVHPRLYVTTGEAAKYVALSHRWPSPESNSRRLITTRRTLSAKCSSIPLDDFPKTFLDAVKMTRALGIQYLWIDSLCIVQDDEEDRKQEVNRMTDVYSNAYLTIAADWSPDSDGGLYGAAHTPFRSFQVTDPNGREHTIRVSRTCCLKSDNVSVLDDRGWVLQERVLSARTVHFGSAEMIWQCAQRSSCHCPESDHNRNRPREWLSAMPPPSRATYPEADFREILGYWRENRALSNLKEDRYPNPRPFNSKTAWHSIIEEYSARKLTFNEDRLPAIAGIAAKLPFPSRTFIAGIWRLWLKEDLIWFTQTQEPSMVSVEYVRLPPSYAPSWSWASVAAPVRFITTELQDSLCLEVQLYPHDHSTAAPYDGLRLSAKGYLLRCQVSKDRQSSPSPHSRKSGPSPYSYSDFSFAFEIANSESYYHGVRMDTNHLSNEWQGQELSVLLFAYTYRKSYLGDEIPETSSSWLLLKRVGSENKRELYTRIGFVEIQFLYNSRSKHEELIENWKKQVSIDII